MPKWIVDRKREAQAEHLAAVWQTVCTAWEQAALFDSLDPEAGVVEFSQDNPHVAHYNELMRQYLELVHRYRL